MKLLVSIVSHLLLCKYVGLPGRKADAVCDGHHGLQSLQLLSAAYLSARNNVFVTLPKSADI